MAENDGKKFFEIFSNKIGKEKSSEQIEESKEELGQKIQGDSAFDQKEEVLAGMETAEEILTKNEKVGENQEVADDGKMISKEQEVQSGSIEKKEYWTALIAAAREEELADDPDENQRQQDEKIVQEAVNLIAENSQAELKNGNAQKAVEFFEKVVLPALKEENPEINEPAYLDEFHAGLKKWGEENRIKDWS